MPDCGVSVHRQEVGEGSPTLYITGILIKKKKKLIHWVQDCYHQLTNASKLPSHR